MSSTTLSVVLTILLLVTFIFLSPSSAVTRETLATICFPTESQEFCENLLNTDPRTCSADLPLLSLISIELTRKQADDNHRTLLQLQENATNSSVKDSLKSCVQLYEEITGKVNEAYRLSQQKRYKDIDQLSEGNALAIKCEVGVPSGYNTTEAISQTMILTFQTAIYVNVYIVDNK